MKTVRPVVVATAFAMAATFAGMASATQNIQLLVHGLATPNTTAAPDSAAFTSWCGGVCFPTTNQDANDPGNGQQKGSIRVWAKDFRVGEGGSLCFSEFIVFVLKQGELHVASGERGTCGAPIDPTLKPPLHADKGALVVFGGGGDGAIVGGTGKYQAWSGTYTDRVFVGFGASDSGVGGIVYYDQLWFSISGK